MTAILGRDAPRHGDKSAAKERPDKLAEIYGSNVRVLNGTDGKQIANAKCFIGPKTTPDSPTYDQLLENNGQVLKKMIAAGNAECVQQMKKGLGL